MEVVPALSDASPFQRRDVAEWTHRDRLTGVLEKGRVETDRWAASTPTAKHAYGKVVDSRDRSLPDGSAQQRQRHQLEVFQTKGPGGSLQVIRTQTVTSTNSCSSWRGPPGGASGQTARPPPITHDFENLQLTLNPIDLSSEKSKASVGRSGSIGARRPPSRPRSLVGKSSTTPIALQDTPSSPTPVVRICHQVRAEQAAARVTKAGDQAARGTKTPADQPAKGTRIVGSQSPRTVIDAKPRDQSASPTIIKDGRDSATASPALKATAINGHVTVSRKKSSSIEDLHNGGASEDRDESGDEGLRRSSKVRRSLQFPLKKLEARGGVCKLLQELEESGRRGATEGRIARKSFEALEDVLRRNISLAAGGGDSAEDRKPDQEEQEEDRSPTGDGSKQLSKRHSFVTVESLKEVRGRLKHLHSPLDGLDTESGMEEDDGIATDDAAKPTPATSVRSYVFGLESCNGRLPVLGTGSLESRTSNRASVNGSRSDEWYNRRKSYGFEAVHGDETNHSRSSALISKFEDRSRLTSTDSGICRSSEQFVFPPLWKRKTQEAELSSGKPAETDVLQVSHSIPISKSIEERIATLDANREDIRKGRTTVVTLGSKTELAQDRPYTNGKEFDSVHCNGELERTQPSYILSKSSTVGSGDGGQVASLPVTVSIPVVQEEPSPSVISRRLFFQQLSQGTSVSIEKPWTQPASKGDISLAPSLIGSRKIDADEWWKNSVTGGNFREEDWKSPGRLSNGVLKRHSIAVDNSWRSFNHLSKSDQHQEEASPEEAGAVSLPPADKEGTKRHSIAVDKLHFLGSDEVVAGRKQKRVEFCKTEVHFAAEPGRFHLVETDEKPPPTNLFRRRRRHSTPAPPPADAGLPIVRFGDSVYEKQLLLGVADDLEERPTTASAETAGSGGLAVRVREEALPEDSFAEISHSLMTIGTEDNEEHCLVESSLDPAPRSILKNYKKPKPYLIGEVEVATYPVDAEPKEEKWGVRLRPVSQEPAPWRPASGPPFRDEVMPAEYSGQSELQKLLRSLRPAHSAPRGAGVALARRDDRPAADGSVAERVRRVEQQVTRGGYSTRVNFGAGEATVVDEREEREMASLKSGWQRREDPSNPSRGISSHPDWLAEPQSQPQPQPQPQPQRSVATAVLPSYADTDRLRAVETLVSTRSGQPKITSIALRYGGETSEPLRFTSKTAISGEGVPSMDRPGPPPAATPRVSTTRLGGGGEAPLKELKAFFDTPSPTRGLHVLPAQDKKPFGLKRENSPVPKPFVPSSRMGVDELVITESVPRKPLASKPADRPRSPVKPAPVFDKEPNTKATQYPASKQLAGTQTSSVKAQSTTASKVMSYERKTPTSMGSQSPKPTRASAAVPLSAEGVEKPASVLLRSSPRARGVAAEPACVRLDAITVSSKTMASASVSTSTQGHVSRVSRAEGVGRVSLSSIQGAEKRETATVPAPALHIKEQDDLQQRTVLGKTSATRMTNGEASPSSAASGKSSHVFGESRRVVRSSSKSPTPVKKVTPPSKNSKPKDFIGRAGNDSPIYQNSSSSRRSASPMSGTGRQREQPSPVYQNCDGHPTEKLECGLDRFDSESAILAELTRAADEILQAVNGYTDEESRRGSSDDDVRRLRERRSAPLGTIDEAPPARRSSDASSRRESHGARRTQRVASSRSKLGPTSSTSSVESFTRETRRVSAAKTERSSSSSANPSSRAARLVQRANSRELLLQTNASSSEDVTSGAEMKKRAPPPRRSRTSSSANKDKDKDGTVSSSRTKDKMGEGSRTRERTSSSRTKTRESLEAREGRSKRVPEMKHHPIKEKTIPAASGLTGGRERASHARHSAHVGTGNAHHQHATTRTKKTSNVQEKTPAGAAKRRTDAPVQI